MAEKTNERVLKDLGKLIHERRVAEGFTQEELSQLSGLSRYYISSIERGSKNITVVVLRKLAGVLNMKSWQWLRKAES